MPILKIPVVNRIKKLAIDDNDGNEVFTIKSESTSKKINIRAEDGISIACKKGFTIRPYDDINESHIHLSENAINFVEFNDFNINKSNLHFNNNLYVISCTDNCIDLKHKNDRIKIGNQLIEISSEDTVKLRATSKTNITLRDDSISIFTPKLLFIEHIDGEDVSTEFNPRTILEDIKYLKERIK